MDWSSHPAIGSKGAISHDSVFGHSSYRAQDDQNAPSTGTLSNI